MKFEIMRIYFLSEFFALLPWRRDLMTPLYCFSSASLIVGPQMVHINPRTYRQSYSHRGTRWVGRGGGVSMEPPWVFDMLQSFETILPSVEGLWSSPQDEIFFMAGGAAVGLWCHQTWPPSWILSRIINNVKTVRINTFLRLTCKITQITVHHHHHHHHYSSIIFLPSSPPPPSLPPPSTRFCCFFLLHHHHHHIFLSGTSAYEENPIS